MSKKTQNKQQRQQKRRQRKTQKKQQKCQQKQQKQRKTQKRQQKRQQQRRSRKQQLKKKQRGGSASEGNNPFEKLNESFIKKNETYALQKLDTYQGNNYSRVNEERSEQNKKNYLIAFDNVKGTNIKTLLGLLKDINLLVEYFYIKDHILEIASALIVLDKYKNNTDEKEREQINDQHNMFDEAKKKYMNAPHAPTQPTTTHAAAATETTGSNISTEQTQTPRSQPTTTHAAAATETTSFTTSPEHPQTPLTFNVKETKTDDNLHCYSIKQAT